MKVKRLTRVKSSWFFVLILVFTLALFSNLCFAGDSLGKEIKEKAKKKKLDHSRVLHAKKNGKSIKFTAANLEHVKSVKEMEEGQVVGFLETELEGDETKLPPGKYNVYLKKEHGKWKAFAESDGKVAAEAARVKVKRREGNEDTGNPKFISEGWCFEVLIGIFPGLCGFCCKTTICW